MIAPTLRVASIVGGTLILRAISVFKVALIIKATLAARVAFPFRGNSFY